MSQPIRVLIIDDHRLFVDALKLLLAGAEGIEIVGTAQSAEDAMDQWGTRDLDVVLMDVELPGGDGIAATEQFRQLNPKAKIVVVTATHQTELIARAINAGASGYVPKTYAADELVTVIRDVATGKVVIPPSELLPALVRVHDAQHDRAYAAYLLTQLTGREIDILQALANGKSTAQIAEALVISRHTVRTYVRRILAKMSVHSRGAAVATAISHGLVKVPLPS